jgi:hypothetical protein
MSTSQRRMSRVVIEVLIPSSKFCLAHLVLTTADADGDQDAGEPREGVESVTLAGKDRNLLLVAVDCNDLITKLRKKVGHADVVELRTLHDDTAAGLEYGDSYGYPVASYDPAASAECYGHHRPSSSYEYFNSSYNPAPYVAHHDYYPAAGDQNGCSIL